MKLLALSLVIAIPRPLIERFRIRRLTWAKALRFCAAAINFMWYETRLMLLIAGCVLAYVLGSMARAWFGGAI